jgi:bifunctional ADP-heptose synthase (sugar kinase/adenylyltransferase)
VCIYESLGVVGKDETGSGLLADLERRGIDVRAVIRRADLETVRKTRVLAGGFHTERARA